MPSERWDDVQEAYSAVRLQPGTSWSLKRDNSAGAPGACRIRGDTKTECWAHAAGSWPRFSRCSCALAPCGLPFLTCFRPHHRAKLQMEAQMRKCRSLHFPFSAHSPITLPSEEVMVTTSNCGRLPSQLSPGLSGALVKPSPSWTIPGSRWPPG